MWDGTAVIQFDTVVSPARVWMDVRMVEVSGDTNVMIQRFSIKVDSMECSDLLTFISAPEAYMWYDAKDGAGVRQQQCDPYTNTLGVVVQLTDPEQGSQKEWTIRIYLGANLTQAWPNVGSDQVLGEIRVRL